MKWNSICKRKSILSPLVLSKFFGAKQSFFQNYAIFLLKLAAIFDYCHANVDKNVSTCSLTLQSIKSMLQFGHKTY